MEQAPPSSPPPQPSLGPPTLALCAMNLAGVVYYEPAEGVPEWFSLLFFMAAYGLLAGISFVILFFFWRRHNWARWLVLATSVLALLNLLLLPSLNPVAQGLVVIEALFGAWLLYWLNTKQVAAIFKRQPSV